MKKSAAQIARIAEQAKDDGRERINARNIVNQLPAHTLPPTGNTGSGYTPGDGSTETSKIADDAVTYAKMQNISAASKLLGRGDSGAGDPQEITLGTGLSISGTTLNVSGSGAPADATYITQTSNGTLSAEQALSSLAAGYMKVANGTGVITSQAVPIPVADGGTGATALPSFSVFKNTNQTGIVTTTFTKVSWQAEVFDTNTNFASDRFTPTIAGKYLLTCSIVWNDSAMEASKTLILDIYKNGARLKTTLMQSNGAAKFQGQTLTVIASANGSTDYFEVYVYHECTANQVLLGTSDGYHTHFSGGWVTP